MNININKSTALVSALLTSIALAPVAHAQLEEIVVTATKRPESLQDIPVSATVLTSRSLDARSISNVAEITASVPNVSYQDRAGGHQTSIGIRGIASNVRNIGLEDSVGVYVDGVYIGRPMFYNIDTAEVSQVEVLRGPQGTLFGKNTVAGALNITTKAIPEEFEAKIKAGFSSFDTTHLKGYLGGMVSDTVGLSLSAVKKDSDGFMENTFNGESLQGVDQYGVSAKVLFRPSDSLDITLTADFSEKDNAANASQIITPGGSFAGNSFGDEPGGLFVGQEGDFTVTEDGPQFYLEEVSGFSATANYDINDNLALTLIGSVRSMDLSAGFDDDNSGLLLVDSIFTDKADQNSLEARLTSNTGGAFEWILGGYYFKQDVESQRLTQAFGSLNVNGDGMIETESLAAFFSGDYQVNERLNFNVGLRLTNDKKKALWNQSGNGAPVFGLPVITLTGDESFTELSPTVSLSYSTSDDTNVYGKISRGFKSGGFMMDLVGPDGFTLEPETVTNYEIGLKSTLADGRLRLNAAAFYMEYEDLQTLNAQGLQFVGANAGEATLKGMEADFELLATDNFRIIGGVGFTDSVYDAFLQNVNGTINDLSGNTLRNAPKLTSNLLAEYTADIGGNLELNLIGEWNTKSKIHYDVANVDTALAPGYSLLNARVVLSGGDGKWSVAAFAKNLTDERYFTFLRNGPFGQQTGLFGQPRSYGVEFKYNIR